MLSTNHVESVNKSTEDMYMRVVQAPDVAKEHFIPAVANNKHISPGEQGPSDKQNTWLAGGAPRPGRRALFATIASTPVSSLVATARVAIPCRACTLTSRLVLEAEGGIPPHEADGKAVLLAARAHSCRKPRQYRFRAAMAPAD